jgi:hypothetical protein
MPLVEHKFNQPDMPKTDIPCPACGAFLMNYNLPAHNIQQQLADGVNSVTAENLICKGYVCSFCGKMWRKEKDAKKYEKKDPDSFKSYRINFDEINTMQDLKRALESMNILVVFGEQGSSSSFKAHKNLFEEIDAKEAIQKETKIS